MKSIHAISTILAIWGMGIPVGAIRPSRPARTGRFEDNSTEGAREMAGRTIPTPPPPGMPNLLAAALLQGGSRTDRRYR